MVKYFSVDWLAQSHHEERVTDTVTVPTCRPHVPCMVQPRPPTYGKGYLQPKPRAPKPAEHTERADSSGQDSSLCSPFHPTSCASPISETSGYSSGYDSEVTSPERLSVDEGGSDAERDAPQRRLRTKFTPEQIGKLEKIFNKHKYLDAGERVRTAHKLSLSETQVRTWFQNRRMKLKRELQDYLAPQIPPVILQPLAPVHQYHSVAARGPHYPATGPAFYALPAAQQLLLQQQQMRPHHHPHHIMVHNTPFY